MATRTQTPPADTPAAWLRTALGSPDPAATIEAVRLLTDRLEEAEQQAVASMRLRGNSWQDVADATGMNSRQAAQHRYERSAGLLDHLDAALGREPRD